MVEVTVNKDSSSRFYAKFRVNSSVTLSVHVSNSSSTSKIAVPGHVGKVLTDPTSQGRLCLGVNLKSNFFRHVSFIYINGRL
jgi:hypothetical protein